jgi:predicted CoA-binding protein
MASLESRQRFLASPAFGVVGASRDRNKFGNRVLRKYLQHGLVAFAVNPKEGEIEGRPSYPDLSKLPPEVQSLSIVTPPAVTEEIVRQAIQKGIPNLWMQPGAESPAAIRLAKEAGLNLIADGSCILVELG